MTDETPIIPMDETSETVSQRRFPVVAQLLILAFVLGAIFSGYWLNQSDSSLAYPTPQPTSLYTEFDVHEPQKIEGVSLRAEAAYVWDIKAQRALYSQNATEALPLASITKLMTTLLAYELVTDDTQANIPLSAIMQEGSSGLTVGERLSTEKLRKLALISSSNDAAYALGATVGAELGDDEPVAQFVTAMNIRAQELGLHTLTFKNTTGLDVSTTVPGAVGSARDVSFLMEYILNNYPEIIEPTQQTAARIYNAAGAYHEVDNTNKVATEIPNLLGSKTGYTDLAGGNLTVAFDVAYNRPIVITVLGSTRDERFTDVLTLVAAVQESMSSIEDLK